MIGTVKSKIMLNMYVCIYHHIPRLTWGISTELLLRVGQLCAFNRKIRGNIQLLNMKFRDWFSTSYTRKCSIATTAKCLLLKWAGVMNFLHCRQTDSFPFERSWTKNSQCWDDGASQHRVCIPEAAEAHFFKIKQGFYHR